MLIKIFTGHTPFQGHLQHLYSAHPNTTKGMHNPFTVFTSTSMAIPNDLWWLLYHCKSCLHGHCWLIQWMALHIPLWFWQWNKYWTEDIIYNICGYWRVQFGWWTKIHIKYISAVSHWLGCQTSPFISRIPWVKWQSWAWCKSCKKNTLNNTGSINNDKVPRAILQYRNTPLPNIHLSPAQILFHCQLWDHIPSHPSHYHLH